MPIELIVGKETLSSVENFSSIESYSKTYRFLTLRSFIDFWLTIFYFWIYLKEFALNYFPKNVLPTFAGFSMFNIASVNESLLTAVFIGD